MRRKLALALAVRNSGSRLYGKPIQNLDIDNSYTILDHIIDGFNKLSNVDEIVLGISEGIENEIFIDYAKKNNIKYVVGDENDVLARLIQCGDLVQATEIIRVTSESPFPYFEKMDEMYEKFSSMNLDALFYDNIVDGCGFEFISLDALKQSHNLGEDRHRSELCTLYIRENLDKFKILKESPNSKYNRLDLRLTVDYPEDLVVCRRVYEHIKKQGTTFSLDNIIAYLDSNPSLKDLVQPYTEEGYSLMYK